MLVEAGADPTTVDAKGHSASYRACYQLEHKFLEGAILIGKFLKLINIAWCMSINFMFFVDMP